MLYISRILNQYILGFFRNSISVGNLSATSVFESSCTKMYIAALCSKSPSNFLIEEVSFERSPFSGIQELFVVKLQKQFLSYFEYTKKYSLTGVFHQYFIQHIS